MKIVEQIKKNYIEYFLAYLVIWHLYQYQTILVMKLLNPVLQQINWTLWFFNFVSIYFLIFNKFRTLNFLFQLFYHSWMPFVFPSVNELHFPYLKISLFFLLLIDHAKNEFEVYWIKNTYWLIFSGFYFYFGITKYLGGVWIKGYSLYTTFSANWIGSLLPQYKVNSEFNIYVILALITMIAQLTCSLALLNKKLKWVYWSILLSIQLGITFFSYLYHIGQVVVFFHLIALIIHKKGETLKDVDNHQLLISR